MIKYLFFLLVLAGCTPVDEKGVPWRDVTTTTAKPTGLGYYVLVIIVFIGGYFWGELHTKRKYHKLFSGYTLLIERLTALARTASKAYDERVTAMLKEVDELRQTRNRLKNERRY